MTMTRSSTDVALVDSYLQRLLVDDEGMRDPYPLYRAIRESARTHQSDLDGFYYVSGYSDCQKVLIDPHAGRQADTSDPAVAFFSSKVQVRRFNQRQRRSMLTANPPEHTRLRSLANRAFTARRVENLRERIVALVDEGIDHMLEAGEVDVMEAFAFKLPVTVIGELIGVPEWDREWFRETVNDFVRAGSADADWEVIDKGEHADLKMESYFVDLANDRRNVPADDMMTGLVQARDGSDKMSEMELLATAQLLFFAGFVTTTNLIGNGLMALLKHPDQMARLWAEPELAVLATDEILRYDSPVQINGRYLFGDVSLPDGTVLPEGASVLTLSGGANRDPERFADPEAFDIGREDNQPISFGWGIHHCLGAPLARLEGQIVFRHLAERIESIELLDGDPPRQKGFFLRGVDELPVRLKAR